MFIEHNIVADYYKCDLCKVLSAAKRTLSAEQHSQQIDKVNAELLAKIQELEQFIKMLGVIDGCYIEYYLKLQFPSIKGHLPIEHWLITLRAKIEAIDKAKGK